MGQSVALDDLPHAVKLVVRIDAIAVVEVCEHGLTPGFHLEYAMPYERLCMPPQPGQAETDARDLPAYQHLGNPVGSASYFRPFRHVVILLE